MLARFVRIAFLELALIVASAPCTVTAQQALSEKRIDSISLNRDPPVTVAFDPTLSRLHNVTPAERKELDNFKSQGVLVEDVIETKINRSGKYFLVSCDSGGSADFGCGFRAVQEAPQAGFMRIEGTRFEVPGDGCVYASGHNNTMFNLRRKFCLSGDRLEEIDQPFHYVGLQSKTKRTLPFFSDLTVKHSVGTIEKGGFVEVLIASSDGSSGLPIHTYFLIRDKKGLTGWIHVEPSSEAEDIEGLYFAGD